MGLIVLHAGMPKAASTYIQSWIEGSAEALARDHGILLAVVRWADGSRKTIKVQPRRNVSILSTPLIEALWEKRPGRRENAERFRADLDALARQQRTVLLSAENIAHGFWRGNDVFLEALERLAQSHEVRVAYYVRPQHSALEAAWRQWGFREPHAPSEYLAGRAKTLHYDVALRNARRLAPSVKFAPRPLCKEELSHGSVLHDFAGRFLDIADVDAQPEGLRSNKGLPLELLIELAHPGPTELWESQHDNRLLDEVKELLADTAFEDTERVLASRAILQAYAFERFEPGNRAVAVKLGWKVDGLIPRPAAPISADLKSLDSLWAPRTPKPVAATLRRALAELATRRLSTKQGHNPGG